MQGVPRSRLGGAQDEVSQRASHSCRSSLRGQHDGEGVHVLSLGLHGGAVCKVHVMMYVCFTRIMESFLWRGDMKRHPAFTWHLASI